MKPHPTPTALPTRRVRPWHALPALVLLVGLALLSLGAGAAAPGSTITDLPDPSILNGASTHIDDQVAYANHLIGPITYTLQAAHPETTVITPTGSSNLSLVPLNGITCGGSGVTRTVTISPTANMTGSSAITLLSSGPGITETIPFTVTVIDVPDLRMPLIMNDMYPGADLRVVRISPWLLKSDVDKDRPRYVQVYIANYGTEPITEEFWVDLYLDPTTAPTEVNQRWEDLGTYGAHWGITTANLPLDPGEGLYLIGTKEYTLTSTSEVGDEAATNIVRNYLVATECNMPAVISSTSQIYVQVDSIDLDTDFGAVLENHEEYGRPYNNITHGWYREPASLAGGDDPFVVLESGTFVNEPPRD